MQILNFLKKYAWWLVGLLIAYIIYRIVSNRAESPKSAPITGNPPNVGPAFEYDPSKVDRKRAFGAGSKNSQEVAYLQTWLNQYYNQGLQVDGDFGPLTAAALQLAKPGANPIKNTLDSLGV